MLFKVHLVMALLLIPAPALALQSFAPTREELMMMPPYCTALYGKYVGLPQLQDSPLRNTVPPNCPSAHHYCDGLKAMVRVNRITDKVESGYWLQQALQSFQGVADEWEAKAPNCSLRAEGYINLGRAQLQMSGRHRGSAGRAVESFSKALELNPNYLDAYYALSDFYVGTKNKQKALSIVEDGLRHFPDSKGLLRRFKELGGKTPPPPLAVAPKSDATDEPNGEINEKNRLPSEANEAKETAAVTAEPPKIGSPQNPHCRFCPPD